MSKVAVKRPAQYRLTFDDDNIRHQRIGAADSDTGRQYDHGNNSTHKQASKKDIEVLILEQLKRQLEEDACLFKKKWNYDLTNRKFLSGNYCWEAKSEKPFPISYAKHCFFPYYGGQPLRSTSDGMCKFKSYGNSDSGTVTPQTDTSNLLSSGIATETLTSTNTSSVRNPATNICNENAEEADSVRFVPITCYKPRDSESDIDRQRPN